MKIFKKIGSISLIAVIGICLIIPLIINILFSIKDYNFMLGLADSPSVGFDNFATAMTQTSFNEAFGRTALISFVSLFIGAIYVFLSSLATGSIKPLIPKAIVAFIFAIPAILPCIFIIYLIYNSFSQQLLLSASTTVILSMFLNSLPLAAILSLVSFFIKEKPLKSALKYCLIFIAIRLILFLTVDFELVYSLQNVYTVENTEIIDTLLYRTGVQNGNYSISAAVYILKYIYQLIPVAIACVILILMKKKFRTNDLVDSKRMFTPLSITPVIVLFIITWIIAIPFIILQNHEIFRNAYLNSFLITSISAMVYSIIAVFLAKSANNIGVAGIILLSLFSMISEFTIGHHMNVRYTSTINTIIAPLIYNFSIVPMISLILYFVIHSRNSSTKDGSLFAITYGAMFIYFWQDFFGTLVYITQRSLYPTQYVLLQLLKETSLAMHSSDANGPLDPFSYCLVFTIVPILIMALSITLAVVLHKTKFLAFKRKNNVAQSTNEVNEELQSANENNTVAESTNNSANQFSQSNSVENDTLEEKTTQDNVSIIEPNNEPVQTKHLEQTPFISESTQKEIIALKQLLDIGIITNEEFEFKKKQLLGL